MRIGFGGYITSRMKRVNASISASGIWLSRPRSPGKATLNALNAKRSLKWPALGGAEGSKAAPVRSPRQCMGPWLSMPRKLWVVITPFIEAKTRVEGVLT